MRMVIIFIWRWSAGAQNFLVPVKDQMTHQHGVSIP